MHSLLLMREASFSPPSTSKMRCNVYRPNNDFACYADIALMPASSQA